MNPKQNNMGGQADSKPSSRPNDETMKLKHDSVAKLSQTTRWLIAALLLAAVATLVVELFYHRHSVFDFESFYGFYALFGFAAYVFIVRSAMLLRRWLKRDEDYYD